MTLSEASGQNILKYFHKLQLEPAASTEMCWVLRVLWLCPVNVESDAHLAALRGEIFLLVKSVGPGVGQDLVVSRNVGSCPDTNNPRSH